jgi:hypothetical protein
MILCILIVPIGLFYLIMHTMATDNFITINGKNIFSTIDVNLKFLTFLFIITSITETILTNLQESKLKINDILHYIFQSTIMFFIYYIFVLIYSKYDLGITVHPHRQLAITAILWVLYMGLDVIYIAVKSIYKKSISHVRNNYN